MTGQKMGSPLFYLGVLSNAKFQLHKLDGWPQEPSYTRHSKYASQMVYIYLLQNFPIYDFQHCGLFFRRVQEEI